MINLSRSRETRGIIKPIIAVVAYAFTSALIISVVYYVVGGGG